MTARNDITGDAIKTRSSTNAYRDNWDAIFGKKKEGTDLPSAVDDAATAMAESASLEQAKWADTKEQK